MILTPLVHYESCAPCGNPVGGLRAFKPNRRGRKLGRGGRLRLAQTQRIRNLVGGNQPDQLKLPLYRLTRAAVASLIDKEYEIAVSLVTIGRSF